MKSIQMHLICMKTIYDKCDTAARKNEWSPILTFGLRQELLEVFNMRLMVSDFVEVSLTSRNGRFSSIFAILSFGLRQLTKRMARGFVLFLIDNWI
mmetsp:Transcript_13214/g.27980  ORF Transcript_13214/g.27980 Transcript_13214/m.27980 type:complete len:96 (-) Transcript_13214:1239-1526(-)